MRSNLVTSISQSSSKRHFDLCGDQLRILVVDDNHNAAEALAAYLSFEDVECRMVFGGAEAICIGTAWLPHVIAMDISMPDALASRLLSRCGTINAPVVSRSLLSPH
jgi:CheY-like chemotaxis protein